MKTLTKIYLISGIFIAILTLVVLGLIWPAVSGIKEESRNLTELKKEKIIFYRQAAVIDDFKKQEQEYKDNFFKAKNMFVDSQNPVSFIKFLEDTAKTSGVNIDINIAAVKDIGFMFLQLDFIGEFNDSMRFLNKLENAPYLISTENIKISKYAESRIKTSCLIKVFAK